MELVMNSPLENQIAVLVREGCVADASALAALYNQEVLKGTSNYENEPQTAETRRQWIEGLTQKGFPLFVAENGDEVVGFAALTPFHPLSGYRFTVSGQVYVKDGHRALGVGRALCDRLLIEALERKYHCILAGVNAKNRASIGLLEAFGFKQVGLFKEIGFKNGEWHDDVCLQRIL